MTKPRKKAARVTGSAAKRGAKRKLRKTGPTNQVRELTAANEWLHNELRVLAAQRDQIDKHCRRAVDEANKSTAALKELMPSCTEAERDATRWRSTAHHTSARLKEIHHQLQVVTENRDEWQRRHEELAEKVRKGGKCTASQEAYDQTIKSNLALAQELDDSKRLTAAAEEREKQALKTAEDWKRCALAAQVKLAAAKELFT